jgi:predicted ATPase
VTARALGCQDGLEAAEAVLRAGLLKLGGGVLGEALSTDSGHCGPRADCGRGHEGALDEAMSHAFPGNWVEITAPGGPFELALRQPGLLRPLRAAELSDGTLRYLLWAAALLTPRPPEMLVLNEPETSLHPELIGPLADLITAASASTQIIVVTHARPLVTAFRDNSARVLELVEEYGRTLLNGQGTLDESACPWPGR